MREDAAYLALFKQAQTEAAQSLEDEASYRAMVGVFEPNVYQGRWLYPQEEYEIAPSSRYEPAVMGWRDLPVSKPLGLWKKFWTRCSCSGCAASIRTNTVRTALCGADRTPAAARSRSWRACRPPAPAFAPRSRPSSPLRLNLPPMMTAQPTEIELADEIGSYYADPLGFVRFAYPWGEPGSPACARARSG